jgi:hypothetical protein
MMGINFLVYYKLNGSIAMAYCNQKNKNKIKKKKRKKRELEEDPLKLPEVTIGRATQTVFNNSGLFYPGYH